VQGVQRTDRFLSGKSRQNSNTNKRRRRVTEDLWTLQFPQFRGWILRCFQGFTAGRQNIPEGISLHVIHFSRP
jgi:hypothetical protein